MDRKIILILAFTVFGFTPLLAQKKAAPKKAPATKTVAPTKNESAPLIVDAASSVNKSFVNCKVVAEPNGCSIVFANVQGKTSVILKKYLVDTKNSVQDVTLGSDALGSPAKKTSEALVIGEDNVEAKTENVTVRNVQLAVTVGGNSKEFKILNGEFNIPADLPYGSYPITITWSWGSTPGKANFKGDFKEGRCVAIYQN